MAASPRAARHHHHRGALRPRRSRPIRSDPIPDDRRAGGVPAAVTELHQLLAALQIATPVVLVGHSLGGRIAESFARTYPHATAGLVSVDGTPTEFYNEGQRDPLFIEGRSGRRFHMLDDRPVPRDPAPLPIPAVVLVSNVERWPAWASERDASSSALARRNEQWQGWQRAAATRLGAAHVAVPASSHLIYRDAPALDAHTVDAVVRAAREHRAQAVLDPQHVHETGGQLMPG